MQGAILDLVIGLGGAAAISVGLWMGARTLRAAPPSSTLGSDAIATALALLLVGGLVVSGAWVVRGAMLLVPDPVTGALVGLIATFLVVGVVVRMFGRLPESRPHEAP